MEQLEKDYNDAIAEAKRDGLNTEVFDAKIPHAAQQKRKADINAQAEELYQKRKMFSVSGIWATMGNMLCNSDAILQVTKCCILESECNQQQRDANRELAAKTRESKVREVVRLYREKAKIL